MERPLPLDELQLTFLPNHADPSEGRFFFYGTPDPLEATLDLGLPPGDPVDTELMTEGGLAEVHGRELPVRPALKPLERIASRPDISGSLAAWARVSNAVLERKYDQLDKLADELPAEGHAAYHSDGHRWNASATVASFFETYAELLRSDSHANRRLITAQHADPGPVELNADLRPYQGHGISWLETVAETGSGAILADDMGLGKTLQAIGLLARRAGESPHLVVCPTSLVGNWKREITRFAPQLSVHVHHGPGRARKLASLPYVDIIVTSYSIALRDIKTLKSWVFDTVVIDEAQAVKNHRSRTAMAVAELTGRVRLALTGTPVENHLHELWAISEFVNPGLLGTQAEFKRRYADAIEAHHNRDAAAGLRAHIDPVVLRRLKEEVASDLPDKIESTVACTLTEEQAQLYSEAINLAFEEGLGEGIARRGRILKLLTELKQICNHPAQALGQNGGKLGDRSGKLDRVTEMCAELVESGGRALVFTQYRAAGEMLAGHFKEALGIDAPFLHGGLDGEARERLVDAFQAAEGPAVLIISLRAGGTGLNLTNANHVIHFDRWWNPAVEDQATDRAHRIGQEQTVYVHKLVTAGTLEERIDELLTRKRFVAQQVVGSGEDWIGEMDDTQFRKLIELDGEGVS
ncbi:DEAD/DEAH box helicase [Salininema proteolyticum]|uniref:DEAD/DEAH box helicase n=1 Tax=Salininema proteolyticum TaxID=1607685 RepID=A0ABV8TUW8_9ACTN